MTYLLALIALLAFTAGFLVGFECCWRVARRWWETPRLYGRRDQWGS